MKRSKAILATAAIVAGLGISGTALAENIAGGTWNYGVGWTGTYGYSNYYHGSRTHSASVKNGNRTVKVTEGRGIWANASITKIPPTGMSYYYGVN